jgi:hypothetical protein
MINDDFRAAGFVCYEFAVNGYLLSRNGQFLAVLVVTDDTFGLVIQYKDGWFRTEMASHSDNVAQLAIARLVRFLAKNDAERLFNLFKG